MVRRDAEQLRTYDAHLRPEGREPWWASAARCVIDRAKEGCDTAVVARHQHAESGADGSTRNRCPWVLYHQMYRDTMKQGNRVCVYSQRGVQRLASRCVGFEFEDVIARIDDADVIVGAPRQYFEWGHRISNRLARHLGVRAPNPGVRPLDLQHDYDLFFAVCMFPSDLASLRAVPSWRDRAEVAVCWLEEVWKTSIDTWKGQMKALADFDIIITNCAGSAAAVQDAVGKPCHYLPPGVDTVLFSPFPDEPNRCIDVYSLGRRSPEVHEALIQLARSSDFFYIYDTFLKLETTRFSQHRLLVANTAKRSNFLLVDQAKSGREFETQGQAEIGFRFFEGAAAGAVMLGSAPATDEWDRHFGWTDAVIELPTGTADLGEWLYELSHDSDRLREARTNNVINSLTRHDWVHRWTRVLELASLEARPKLGERVSTLEHLASLAEARASK